MLGRAVEAEIDAIGHRCPGWVLRTAVEAYLYAGDQSVCQIPCLIAARTLFDGLDLTLSKILKDWDFDARLILSGRSMTDHYSLRKEWYNRYLVSVWTPVAIK